MWLLLLRNHKGCCRLGLGSELGPPGQCLEGWGAGRSVSGKRSRWELGLQGTEG